MPRRKNRQRANNRARNTNASSSQSHRNRDAYQEGRNLVRQMGASTIEDSTSTLIERSDENDDARSEISTGTSGMIHSDDNPEARDIESPLDDVQSVVGSEENDTTLTGQAATPEITVVNDDDDSIPQDAHENNVISPKGKEKAAAGDEEGDPNRGGEIDEAEPLLVGICLFYEKVAISDEVITTFENLDTIAAVITFAKKMFIKEMQEVVIGTDGSVTGADDDNVAAIQKGIPANTKFFGLTCSDPHPVDETLDEVHHYTIRTEKVYAEWYEGVTDMPIWEGQFPYIQVCLVSEDSMIKDGREFENWFEKEVSSGQSNPVSELKGTVWEMEKLAQPENQFINEETCEMGGDDDNRIMFPEFRVLARLQYEKEDAEFREEYERQVAQASAAMKYSEAVKEAKRDLKATEEEYAALKEDSEARFRIVLDKKKEIQQLLKDIKAVEDELRNGGMEIGS